MSGAKDVMRYEYPARFKKEGSATLISFRDLPEAISFAEEGEDPWDAAQGALQAALEVRIERDEEIPVASAARRGEPLIPVPVETALKAALLAALRQHDQTRVSLARRLKINEKVIRRMLDPHHSTKPEKLLKALGSLGQAPVVEMRFDWPHVSERARASTRTPPAAKRAASAKKTRELLAA
jgi:antitoxin HicB